MKSIISILFIFSFFSLFAQGLIDGFLKSTDENTFAFSGGYQQSDRYLAGHKLIDYKRSLNYASVYYARGISKRMDAGLSVPLINGKLQDLSLYTKYQLLSKQGKRSQIDVFPAILISFPLSAYPTDIGQAIGQRAVVFSPRLIVQQRFNSGFFYQLQTGYNQTLAPVPASFPASVKLGWGGSKWYFDAWFDYQEGLGTADYLGSVPFDSFRELTVSYQRSGFTIYRNTNWGKKKSPPEKDHFHQFDWGWALNGAYTFGGRNTGIGWAAGLALIMKITPGKF